MTAHFLALLSLTRCISIDLISKAEKEGHEYKNKATLEAESIVLTARLQRCASLYRVTNSLLSPVDKSNKAGSLLSM